jgi:hypothetical protein
LHDILSNNALKDIVADILAQASKHEELKSVLLDIHQKRMEILKLTTEMYQDKDGKWHRKNVDDERNPDLTLTKKQLKELNELEELASEVVIKLNALIKEQEKANAAALQAAHEEGVKEWKENGKQVWKINGDKIGKVAREGNIPGTEDTVDKLEAFRDLLHSAITISPNPKYNPDKGNNKKRMWDLREISNPKILKLIEKIEKGDRKTRELVRTVKYAAEGNDAALETFFESFKTGYDYKFPIKTPSGEEVKNASEFREVMKALPPQIRADKIYGWSGFPKDVSENITEILEKDSKAMLGVENPSQLSLSHNLKPYIDKLIRIRDIIIHSGDEYIDSRAPRNPADIVDKTSYTSQKNQDYARGGM